MAAHVLTALKEIDRRFITGNNIAWDQLQAALDLSCWTEDLEYEDYRDLRDIVTRQDIEALTGFVRELIVAYNLIWESMNQPRNREDWLKIKYGL